MNNKHKIVYMGTPHYAREILGTLISAEDMDVALVLTQPDRPVGRKRVMTPPPVKMLAQENNIEVLQPTTLSDDGIVKRIRDARPDFIIVAAFGQILPKSILDIAPCINLHASILPQYRGASPIQQSLLNGDSITGVTAMLMEEGLDSGDILCIKEFEIPSDMRLQALTEQLTNDAKELTLETIRDFENITPIKQDEIKVTYCKKIKKSDGLVDFLDAIEVYNKYRAFEGWPGIFAENGLKFEDLKLIDSDSQHTPFELISFDGEGGIVGCKNGLLKVGKLQPSGKKEMSLKAYCVGRGIKVGNTIL